MPWVEFTADFNYRLKPTVWKSYKAGARALVMSECARQAIAKGKAKPIEREEKNASR